MHAVWTAEYAAKRPNRDALEKRINAIMDAFDKESAEVHPCFSQFLLLRLLFVIIFMFGLTRSAQSRRLLLDSTREDEQGWTTVATRLCSCINILAIKT